MTLPTFRLIAIAGTLRRVDEVLEGASRLKGCRFGLMLRSPGHRCTEVQDLASHLASLDAPPNVVPIANGCRIPGIEWYHATAADIARKSTLEATVDAGHSIHFGASVHSPEEAVAALAHSATYLLVSPIYPTPSKPGHLGMGCDQLRAIVGSAGCPVFALGGVASWNINELLRSGIFGVASIGLFDPLRSDELASVADAMYNFSPL